jgi:hypothetical protein
MEILHKKKIQQDATVYQNFGSYLYEAQNVAGNTPAQPKHVELHINMK